MLHFSFINWGYRNPARMIYLMKHSSGSRVPSTKWIRRAPVLLNSDISLQLKRPNCLFCIQTPTTKCCSADTFAIEKMIMHQAHLQKLCPQQLIAFCSWHYFTCALVRYHMGVVRTLRSDSGLWFYNWSWCSFNYDKGWIRFKKTSLLKYCPGYHFKTIKHSACTVNMMRTVKCNPQIS